MIYINQDNKRNVKVNSSLSSEVLLLWNNELGNHNVNAENYALEKRLSALILNSGFQRTKAHDFYESKDFDKLSYCFTKKF